MKSIITTIFFMFFGLVLNAQNVNPDIVVNEMPVITMNVCKKEIREQFLKKVDKLKTEVSEEITLRKSKTKEKVKGFDEQASKNMMKQSGYSVSDADIQKMKTASKEEKKAMAMAMMQQNMNMSVDEAKKVSKMSKEGQKAWAEGMSTEMMADAQANPDKNKVMQKNNMGMAEMAQEQSQLAQKIQLSSQKFAEQLEEFNKLKEKTRIEYEACLKKVDKEFENKVNHVLGDEYYESIKLQKETCYQIYCGYLTPKYKSILLERFNTIIALGGDFNRMDVLTNELANATTGSKKDVYEPGLMYLEALKEYMEHLEDLP